VTIGYDVSLIRPVCIRNLLMDSSAVLS
jgi:hypothetical protein